MTSFMPTHDECLLCARHGTGHWTHTRDHITLHCGTSSVRGAHTRKEQVNMTCGKHYEGKEGKKCGVSVRENSRITFRIKK